MASKRTKVILVAAVGILVLGPLLALVLLPVWFPWAVRGFTSKSPLSYSSYERVGLGGFRLVDAGFTNAGVKFSAGTVQGPLPTTWAWQRWQGSGASNATPVRLENWRLVVEPTGRGPTSVYTNVIQALQAIDSVAKWLPAAVASNGTATVSGTTLNLPQTTWQEGAVLTTLNLPDAGITGTVSIASQPDGSRLVSLVSTQTHLQADFRLSTSETNLAVEGQGTWEGNRLDLQATFGRAGTLPETATLNTTNLSIPAERLNLQGYRPLTGVVSGEWNRGRFTVSAGMTAEPDVSRTNYPRAVVRLQATGDTNAAVIETARVELPWLQANLSEPVRVIYEAPFVTTPASFSFSADLTNQPFVPVKGRLIGSLNASRGSGSYPVVDFSVTGDGIEFQKLSGASLQVTGGLDYPMLRVTNASIILADHSSATLGGVFDLQSRTVLDGSLQAGGHLADPWLPTEISYGDASVSAAFHGLLKSLSHTGKVTVSQLRLPNAPPLAVVSEWSGTNLDFSLLQVGVRSTNLMGHLRTSVQLTRSSAHLGLQALSVQEEGQVLLGLLAPSEIELAIESNQVRFSASPIRLAGRAGMLELDGRGLWPSRGALRLTGTNLNSEALSNYIKAPVSVRVHNLQASGSWSNGPASVVLNLHSSGKWLGAPVTNSAMVGEQIDARVSLASSGDSLAVSNLLLSANSVPLVSATGLLPVTIWPGATSGIIRVVPSAPVQFKAEASSRSALWPELGRLAGLDLRAPELHLDVRGTLRAPEGTLRANVQSVAFSATNTLPVNLRDLAVDIGFNRRQAQINLARVLVQGQPLQISGSLPLGERFWEGLRTNALPDWRSANLRVLFTNAPVSAFAVLYPSLLVPEGLLNLDLSVRDGGAYGNLTVAGASLRPIPGLGPIRAIDLKVLFNGGRARLENTTARFGSSTLVLAGDADIAEWDWRQEPLPPARLTLKGNEVPLSRTPDLILRGDLDLRLLKTNGAPMRVTGSAQLKKSFLLTDLRDLVSGGTAGSRRAPPFFSIQAPFLAPWRLDLAVTGEKFMKVRSSVFNGQVSANLKLLGTLKEPISLGDVQIDSGVVRFPFTSFRVQQGTALVTSQDPTRPSLNVVANAKQFGYDLKLEVTGSADAPILQFSSTPPLSSDLILLMITAGQLPGTEQVVTAQQRAQAFATFLGRDLINKLGGSEPSEPRLTVQSGQQVTDEGRPTYLVEYMFVDDWYLVGEYDRFNQFNVGVKWRFYSK